MPRWNGWGEETVHIDLTDRVLEILQNAAGPGNRYDDCPVDNLLEKIPGGRLPKHPLVSTEPRLRLDCSHGQGVPDLVDLRMGTLEEFPDGVAMPGAIEDVEELLEFADAHKIVVVPFGGGTSVSGQVRMPEDDRPVMALSLGQLSQLIKFDHENRLADFEPGITLAQIENILGPKQFTLGHFPETFEYTTLGGSIMTRSAGLADGGYGGIQDIFAGGELITPKGNLQLSPFPSPAGPDLSKLVVGSEGRLGVLARATVKISPAPETDEVMGLFFPEWDNAADTVRELAQTGVPFATLRAANPAETAMNLALSGYPGVVDAIFEELRSYGMDETKTCFCLTGFAGTRSVAEECRSEILRTMKKNRGVLAGAISGEDWRKNRFRLPYLKNALWDAGYVIDTAETSVLWDRLPAAVEAIENALQNALKSKNESAHIFTHISHSRPSGAAIRTTFVFRRAKTAETTKARWRTLKKAANRAISDSKGAVSHTRGIGTDLANEFENEMGTVGTGILKQILEYADPDGLMNPGKLVGKQGTAKNYQLSIPF